MPRQKNSFLNLILNLRVNSHIPIVEPAQACGGRANISRDAKAYAALDLGATRDMTALVLVAQDVDGFFHVQPPFWLPRDVRDREGEDHASYVEWIERGLLSVIGEATDPRVVALKIAELKGQYRIQTSAYDRWRINDLKRDLDEMGCNVKLVPHGQRFRDLRPAADILER